MDRSGLNYSRLTKVIREDRKVMEKPRKNRKDMATLVAGFYYSDAGPAVPDPVNLLAMYQQIISRSLVAQTPRYALSTFDPKMKPLVAASQDWLNPLIDEQDLGHVMQEVATDGLYLAGQAMVHLASPLDSVASGFRIKAGTPMVSRISFNDAAWDMQATTWRSMAYSAHRCLVPKQAAEDFYKTKLQRAYPSQYNETGDVQARSIQRGNFPVISEEAEDMTYIWYCYYPRYKAVMVFPDMGMAGPGLKSDGKPLDEMGWIGHESGPYEYLSYGIVPDNLLPLAPMMNLRPLHAAANVCYRKLVDTAADMKEIGLVKGQFSETGFTLVKANHMQMYSVQEPEAAKMMVVGGRLSDSLMKFAMMFKDLFNFVGGNLALLGGRAPQSGTLGQDEMLNQNASAGIADLQDRTTKFATNIGQKYWWYCWHHPSMVFTSQYEKAGFTTNRLIYPSGHPEANALMMSGQQPMIRSGPEPRIKVEPYSLRPQTPEQKAKLLVDFIMQIYTPLAQVFQQSGFAVNPDFLLQKLGQYWDVPDLAELMQTMQPMTDPSGSSDATGPSHGRTMPVHTQRTVNRRSNSQATEDGAIRNMIGSMSASNSEVGDVGE